MVTDCQCGGRRKKSDESDGVRCCQIFSWWCWHWRVSGWSNRTHLTNTLHIRIMELSYQGTFVPRNLRSLELSSPRVKFTWNFRSQTLRLLFYVGILSVTAIESSRAIKTFSVIVFVQVSYVFYVGILSYVGIKFDVYLLRRRPTLWCKYSEWRLVIPLINGRRMPACFDSSCFDSFSRYSFTRPVSKACVVTTAANV